MNIYKDEVEGAGEMCVESFVFTRDFALSILPIVKKMKDGGYNLYQIKHIFDLGFERIATSMMFRVDDIESDIRNFKHVDECIDMEERDT